MLTRSKIIVVAGIVAIVAALGLGGLVWLLVSAGGETPDTEQLVDDLEAPFTAPTAWSDDIPADQLIVQIWQGPSWQTRAGAPIFEGPAATNRNTEWLRTAVDDWKVVLGRSTESGVDLSTQIWSAPNAPVVIVDLEATIEADALGEEVAVTTTHPLARGHLITSALEEVSLADSFDSVEILGAILESDYMPLTIQSMGSARGVARPTAGGLEVDWILWPGLDDAPDCGGGEAGEVEEQVLVVSLRLVVQFGAGALAGPMPEQISLESAATPIFVDPPSVHGDPWLDGSARDAGDLARRLRALAFGHSDRDDPRYGNGGLLATGLGAVFAVPGQWWEEPPVAELRSSLEGTAIEVLPLTDDGNSQRSVAFGDDYCDLLHRSDGRQAPTILVSSDDDQMFSAGLTAPLPPVIEVGRGPIHRDRLLDRLFTPDRQNSLFFHGEYRIQQIPVVATRNPLEDIAHQAILSPDRGGHWTLDDTLTRRLSRWDFEPTNDARKFLGFQDLHQSQRSDKIPEFGDGLDAVEIVFTP